MEYLSRITFTLGFSLRARCVSICVCTKQRRRNIEKAIQGIIIEIWAMMRLFYFVHAFFIHGKRITVNVNWIKLNLSSRTLFTPLVFRLPVKPWRIKTPTFIDTLQRFDKFSYILCIIVLYLQARAYLKPDWRPGPPRCWLTAGNAGSRLICIYLTYYWIRYRMQPYYT